MRYFSNQYRAGAFITGLIIYLLDSLIFILVSDWLAVGFHVFALIMINGGYLQLKRAKVWLATEADEV